MVLGEQPKGSWGEWDGLPKVGVRLTTALEDSSVRKSR